MQIQFLENYVYTCALVGSLWTLNNYIFSNRESCAVQLLLGGHQMREIARGKSRNEAMQRKDGEWRRQHYGDKYKTRIMDVCVSWRFAWFVQIRRIVVPAVLFAFAYRDAFCLYMCICICICVCLLAWVCCICELGSSSFICLPCCCCLTLFGRFWFGVLGRMILYGRWSLSLPLPGFPSIVRFSRPSSLFLLSSSVILIGYSGTSKAWTEPYQNLNYRLPSDYPSVNSNTFNILIISQYFY